MKPIIASTTRIITAPADKIYKIIADYRSGHPLIVPKENFLSLEVETGGFGEGTIVRFQMKMLGRTQTFRSRISEPIPGRHLVETDLTTGVVTSFTVSPCEDENHTQVTISTELNGFNVVQAILAKPMLQKVYANELELLSKTVGKFVTPTQATDTVSGSAAPPR